jgi:hypothetical protein
MLLRRVHGAASEGNLVSDRGAPKRVDLTVCLDGAYDSGHMTRSARALGAFVLAAVASCGHERGGDGPAAKGPPGDTPATATAKAPAARGPLRPAGDGGAAPEDDRLADGLRRQGAWLDALPTCRRDEVAAASRASPAPASGKHHEVRVRGRLTPTASHCTMMQCWPAGACCNSCGWAWAVAPLEGKASLRVQRSGAPEPLAGDGLDCVMNHLPSPDVVVAGRLASSGDLVTEAQLCRVAGD